jgi:hypothetical protein
MCGHLFSVFGYWFNGSCPQAFDIYGFNWNYPLNTYFVFLGLTLLFETPFYYLFLRKNFSILKILRVSLVLNLLTHPLIFLVFPRIADEQGITYGWYVLAAESFALVVEWLVLWRAFKSPFLISLWIAATANLFSWLIGGEIVQYFMH